MKPCIWHFKENGVDLSNHSQIGAMLIPVHDAITILAGGGSVIRATDADEVCRQI
jgi:hypothetical protein